MSTKTFKVVKPLSIRKTASLNAERVGDGFQPGTVITVDANSRTEADNFVWWQHDLGWSAECKTDGTTILMEEVATPAPSIPTSSNEEDVVHFYVYQPVKVRMSPAGNEVPDTILQPNTTIEAVPGSRTVVGRFVWWQHDLGWSISESTDGSKVFMVEISSPHEAPPELETEPDDGEAEAPPPAAEKEGRTGTVRRPFRVMIEVKIRKDPGLNGEELEERLQPGVIVEVDKDSRTEVDGFVWWKHDKGWSAGSNVAGSSVFFGDPDAPAPGSSESQGSSDGVSSTDGGITVDELPMRNQLFTRLPVDIGQTAWVQYFGNTNFAFEKGADWGYPSFSQGLHSGFDFGNGTNNFSGAIPVFAGVSGTFIRNNKYGVVVQSGQYEVIYQHVSETHSYAKSGQVWPDTQIGILNPSYGSNRHLHLEVRYKGKYIVNPLLMMPEAMRQSLLTRFTTYDMCSANGWTQWQTPLDQPIIVLGAPVIGPTA